MSIATSNSTRASHSSTRAGDGAVPSASMLGDIGGGASRFAPAPASTLSDERFPMRRMENSSCWTPAIAPGC
jgi:hypothetical protein